jgi:hypothetical protein
VGCVVGVQPRETVDAEVVGQDDEGYEAEDPDPGVNGDRRKGFVDEPVDESFSASSSVSSSASLARTRPRRAMADGHRVRTLGRDHRPRVTTHATTYASTVGR